MLANRLYHIGGRLLKSPVAGVVVRALLYTPLGWCAALAILLGVDPRRRRNGVRHLMRLASNWFVQRRVIALAKCLEWLSGRTAKAGAASEIVWLACAFSRRPEWFRSMFSAPDAEHLIGRDAAGASLLMARAIARYEMGRYAEAAADFAHAAGRDPQALATVNAALSAAFAEGLLGRRRHAIEHFARQYGFFPAFESLAEHDLLQRFDEIVFGKVFDLLAGRMMFHERARQDRLRYGVFFLSSTQALGHAILDPYHFLALNRERYDKIFFIGPPHAAYRPASATCLEMVAQFGDYLETADDALLNLSWMSLGTRRAGQVELVIEHYWSLLREAVRRSRDPGDPFRHNGWHMGLPAAFKTVGERFCERNGIDLDRPLVVLHARDPGYHRLGKQAFRDASVANYLPAIRHLLDEGYQVIRIGDRHMPRLHRRLAHERYRELPFCVDYEHALDPFLVSRSRFMIGCQSGPCAYARVLGVPLLSVNAVLHYTLLPARMEMACFKRYFHQEARARRQLSLEAALDAGVYHFDNAYQYSEAGIGLADAEPDEIIAAVDDMIAWLDNPALAETDAQARFRGAVERKTRELTDAGPGLRLPIGDYVGIALPGYRISPSVAAMRSARAPGPAARHGEAPVGLKRSA